VYIVKSYKSSERNSDTFKWGPVSCLSSRVVGGGGEGFRVYIPTQKNCSSRNLKKGRPRATKGSRDDDDNDHII
jgi:hypothetical protein